MTPPQFRIFATVASHLKIAKAAQALRMRAAIFVKAPEGVSSFSFELFENRSSSIWTCLSIGSTYSRNSTPLSISSIPLPVRVKSEIL
jgi:hypothetical protein